MKIYLEHKHHIARQANHMNDDGRPVLAFPLTRQHIRHKLLQPIVAGQDFPNFVHRCAARGPNKEGPFPTAPGFHAKFRCTILRPGEWLDGLLCLTRVAAATALSRWERGGVRRSNVSDYWLNIFVGT